MDTATTLKLIEVASIHAIGRLDLVLSLPPVPPSTKRTAALLQPQQHHQGGSSSYRNGGVSPTPGASSITPKVGSAKNSRRGSFSTTPQMKTPTGQIVNGVSNGTSGGSGGASHSAARGFTVVDGSGHRPVVHSNLKRFSSLTPAQNQGLTNVSTSSALGSRRLATSSPFLHQSSDSKAVAGGQRSVTPNGLGRSGVRPVSPLLSGSRRVGTVAAPPDLSANKRSQVHQQHALEKQQQGTAAAAGPAKTTATTTTTTVSPPTSSGSYKSQPPVRLKLNVTRSPPPEQKTKVEGKAEQLPKDSSAPTVEGKKDEGQTKTAGAPPSSRKEGEPTPEAVPFPSLDTHHDQPTPSGSNDAVLEVEETTQMTENEGDAVAAKEDESRISGDASKDEKQQPAGQEDAEKATATTPVTTSETNSPVRPSPVPIPKLQLNRLAKKPYQPVRVAAPIKNKHPYSRTNSAVVAPPPTTSASTGSGSHGSTPTDAPLSPPQPVALKKKPIVSNAPPTLVIKKNATSSEKNTPTSASANDKAVASNSNVEEHSAENPFAEQEGQEYDLSTPPPPCCGTPPPVPSKPLDDVVDTDEAPQPIVSSNGAANDDDNTTAAETNHNTETTTVGASSSNATTTTANGDDAAGYTPASLKKEPAASSSKNGTPTPAAEGTDTTEEKKDELGKVVVLPQTNSSSDNKVRNDTEDLTTFSDGNRTPTTPNTPPPAVGSDVDEMSPDVVQLKVKLNPVAEGAPKVMHLNLKGIAKE